MSHPASIRKALLIYNWHSGRGRQLREVRVQEAAATFRAAGVETLLMPTSRPGSAGEQAREAFKRGCDTVVACGGDGTVHEVLQGLAGTDAALGVIPMGTGNALAVDLGLPRQPAAAARLLLRAVSRRVPLGRVEYASPGASRYFLAVAGVGADADLIYKLAFDFKTRFGMLAYYAIGTQLWLQQDFIPFTAEFVDGERGLRRERVTQILAVHITQFGGLLRQLAPRAALGRDDFQLVLFKSPGRIRYFRYLLGVFFQRHWPVPGIETIAARQVECRPLESSRPVRVQADGELLSCLPASIRITAETVSLLIPEARLPAFDQIASAAPRSEKLNSSAEKFQMLLSL